MRPELTGAEIYLLAVVATAFGLIVSGRLPADVVALLVLLALGLGGVVTPAQALAGFSSAAVITIAALYIISAGLERTGAVAWLADRLARLSGHTAPRIALVFMLAGAFLSMLMNNIAAGAVLLPAAVRVARQSGVRPSKVLIPLAHGTLLGGMATLFTTANIIVSNNLQQAGYRALTMLDFLPSGGMTLAAGVVFMLAIGLRLLPDREAPYHVATSADLRATYQLDERLWEVRVAPTSSLIGRSLRESAIGERLGVQVMGIWHGTEARIPPAPNDVIDAGDILLVLGREERVRRLEAERAFIGRDGSSGLPLRRQAVELTEVIIGPRSPAIGQTLRDLRFRSKYGLTTVAIWRGGRAYRTDVGSMPLQAGDALLMVGPPERVRQLAQEPGFILLTQPPAIAPDRGKAIAAALITAAAVGVSSGGLIPTPEAMLAGAVAMVLAGCVDMENAYRTIEWRVLFIIAGMLPISTAMQATGLARQTGELFVGLLAPLGPLALVAGLWLFAMLLTQLVGGQVTALIAGPIAIATAAHAGVNPPAVAVAVAMACSAAFLTPLAHPVNLLVMSPGGYTFRDFVRVGVWMAVVCFLTLLVVMPLFWGVR
jgi:di/tricarboxylate transporter